jgi:hypothetical protein
MQANTNSRNLFQTQIYADLHWFLGFIALIRVHLWNLWLKLRRQKTKDRRQKTEGRMGKLGNQDNRVQVIRTTGNQEGTGFASG